MKKYFAVSLIALIVATLQMPSVSLGQALQQGCSGTPASVGFLPASGNVAKNAAGNIEVYVLLNTGGCDSGAADVTVKYNPDQLTFVLNQSSYIAAGAEGNPATFYPNTGVYSIKEVSPAGTIRSARGVGGGDPLTNTTTPGKFMKLTFTPKPGVTTTTLNFNYTAGSTTDFTTVASGSGSDILGSAPSATLTIADVPPPPPPPPPTDPVITSVTPDRGDKNEAKSITITGNNFGATQGTGTVTVGVGVTVTSWSNTAITATVVTWPTLAVETPVNVSVKTNDNKTATKVNGYTYTVAGGFVPNPNPGMNSSDPVITAIRPRTGNINIPTEIEILGNNFGSYDPAKSFVAMGVKAATILDWSNNRIVIEAPMEPTLLSRTTRSITVTRFDGKQASYTGFTYVTGPLPNSGPEEVMWALLLLASLSLSGLAYYKLSAKPRAQV